MISVKVPFSFSANLDFCRFCWAPCWLYALRLQSCALLHTSIFLIGGGGLGVRPYAARCSCSFGVRGLFFVPLGGHPLGGSGLCCCFFGGCWAPPRPVRGAGFVWTWSHPGVGAACGLHVIGFAQIPGGDLFLGVRRWIVLSGIDVCSCASP